MLLAFVVSDASAINNKSLKKKKSPIAVTGNPATKITTFSSMSGINKVENYLNSIGNLQADFVQINGDGALSTGKFYISKPGKMRFEYSDPQRLLLILNNENMLYYDESLDELTRFEAEKFPLSMCARNNIKFDQNVKLSTFQEKRGVYVVTLESEDDPEHPKVNLIFTKSPIALKHIEMIGEGDKISVTFENITYPAQLSDKLFRFHKPVSEFSKVR